jgi:apolipoprotein N-acyltransferase
MQAWSQHFLRSRYAVAILAGLLLAAAFPKPGLAGMAWVAPGLLAAAALGQGAGNRFRIGYVGGLAFTLAAYYWLLLIPYRWLGVPVAPALGWIGLAAYLALYPALWVCALFLFPFRSGSVMEGAAEPQLRLEFPRSWLGRQIWCLYGAATWVALEMIVSRLFTGMPWNLLGVSQYPLVPLIQVATFTGVYGVSFMVVWVSLSLLSAALQVIGRPTMRSVWVAELIVPLLALAVLFSHGMRQLREDAPTSRGLRIALVQPSIPQTLIWDSTQDNARFRELLELSEQALTNEVDLLIWPEAAVPSLLRYHQETYDAVMHLARRHKVWLIIGADDAERRPNPRPGAEADFYNSSFLISPEGILENRYRKRNLVIFGEYVPLTRWLPFLAWFTPVQGGFTPGDRPVQFRLPNLGVQTAVLICFEDIFPNLVRESVDPETDFLVNLTNNGWFGESAAQWQHAAAAIFRAVENGRPLIRSANNGLTCWVDGRGRLRQIFRTSSGSIYGAGWMWFELPLPGANEPKPLTFYRQHGDVFGWTCVLAAGLLLSARIPRAVRGARR